MRTKDKISIALDERWKQKLSDENRNIFERIAGAVNKTLGYRD
jgi:hypothetical protein